jgi:hypothetical protein
VIHLPFTSIDDDDQSYIANLLANNAIRYEEHFMVFIGCMSTTPPNDDTFTIENVIGYSEFPTVPQNPLSLRSGGSFSSMVIPVPSSTGEQSKDETALNAQGVSQAKKSVYPFDSPHIR